MKAEMCGMMRGAVLGLLLWAGVSCAGHGRFYPYDDGNPATKVYVVGRYGGYCPSGNVLQTIGRNVSTAGVPTNVPPYLATGEVLSVSQQAAPRMGTDPLFFYYYGDGVFGSLLDVPDTHLYGYVRAFSGTAIPGSAYYGNSPCEPVNQHNTVPSDNMIVSNVVVGSVNPAYIIPWVVVPHKTNDDTTISGQVDTAEGHNNKLAPGEVLVQVREKPAGDWTTVVLPYQPGYEGDFQVRAVWIGGALPVSATYDVDGVVPEAGVVGVLVGMMVLVWRRR